MTWRRSNSSEPFSLEKKELPVSGSPFSFPCRFDEMALVLPGFEQDLAQQLRLLLEFLLGIGIEVVQRVGHDAVYTRLREPKLTNAGRQPKICKDLLEIV